jgi:hypothetical protein
MGKYILNNKIFTSQVKIKTYAEKIIQELYSSSKTEKVIITLNSFGGKFLLEILNKHPWKYEKIGTGIDSFIIKKNKINSRGFEINIKRNDGSIIDFSWVKCVKGKFPTNNKKLLEAMREAISIQIISYKNTHKHICKNCRETSKAQRYHVDHDNPEFKELSETFLKENKNHPKQFGENIDTHITKFLIKDHLFEKKWQKFHKTYANLQILCESCNLRKKL